MSANRSMILLGALIGLAALWLWKRDQVTQIVSEGIMSVSDSIKSLIGGEEGFSPTPYLDPPGNTKGQYSIGYGHLIQPSDPYWPYGSVTQITEAQGSALLDQDTANARNAVTRLVQVPLTDNQFAALTSFVYNVGAGNFASSTLLKLLNAGDYQGAADQLDQWVNAGGVRSDALVARRAHEKEVFLA